MNFDKMCEVLREKKIMFVWDVDRTLVDAEHYAAHLHRCLHISFGLDYDDEHLNNVYYLHKSKFYGTKWGKNLEAQIDFVKEKYTPNFRKLFETDTTYSYVTLYEKVVKFIKKLKEKGIPSAVFSSANAVFFNNIAKYFEIENLFEYAFVTNFGSIGKDKPSGDGLKYISEQTGVPTSNMVMVGDNKVDILAGKDVGAMTALTLYNGMAKELYNKTDVAEYANPDVVIHSEDELEKILECVYNKVVVEE